MIIIMLELIIIMYKHIVFLDQIEMELYHASLQLSHILLSVMMARELLQDPGRPNIITFNSLAETDIDRSEAYYDQTVELAVVMV